MVENEITNLLDQISAGDGDAAERLLPLVYEDLRRLARAYFADERNEHTLQPTALVHEAYIRLANWENVSWQNRAHFFAVAADVMRKVLIDHARRKNAMKRDGGQKILLDEAAEFSGEKQLDLVKLDEALQTLEKIDAQQAKIVELKFFAGLTNEEIAEVVGTSDSTVKREWRIAKAWLHDQLKGE